MPQQPVLYSRSALAVFVCQCCRPVQKQPPCLPLAALQLPCDTNKRWAVKPNTSLGCQRAAVKTDDDDDDGYGDDDDDNNHHEIITFD